MRRKGVSHYYFVDPFAYAYFTPVGRPSQFYGGEAVPDAHGKSIQLLLTYNLDDWTQGGWAHFLEGTHFDQKAWKWCLKGPIVFPQKSLIYKGNF